VSVPASVTVPAGASAVTFGITTSPVSIQTVTSLTATYNGVEKTATFTVNPAASGPATLAALTLAQTRVVGGTPATATVTLSGPAPAAGTVVTLQSKNSAASVPASVTVPAGATSKTFTINTVAVPRNISTTISASYAGVTRKAALAILRR
jgi:hypothetical protein